MDKQEKLKKLREITNPGSGDILSLIKKLEMIKGDKGEGPTKEELVQIIKPLIPEPVKGDKGDTVMPTRTELEAIIKPLIPQPIKGDPGNPGKGEKPSLAELEQAIKPLIPKPIKGDPGKNALPVDTEKLKGEIYQELKKKPIAEIADVSDLINFLRRGGFRGGAGSGSGGVTSISNSDGTLTISPTTGIVIASLNLNNVNTWLARQTFSTSTISITGGANTNILSTDGAGNLSWVAISTGTVTSVSVVSANGFAGTVANPTTTPAITLTTTITGILKGNGTAISAATDADITGKLLTGYVSGAGTVAATDSILQAIQKLNGNIGALVTGVSSVSNSDGTLTITPTTGAVVASLALGHANTWTGQQTFNTSTAIFGVAPTFSTMTLGSILFAGTAGIVTQDNAKFFWDDTNFRLGLSTATPSFDLSLGGEAARTISMERRTSSNSGNNLLIQAGSANVGGSNKIGGSLTLAAGIGTGAGAVNTTHLNFAIPLYQTGAGATVDQTLTTIMFLQGKSNTPFVNISTALLTRPNAPTSLQISSVPQWTGAGVTEKLLDLQWNTSNVINSGATNAIIGLNMGLQNNATTSVSGMVTNITGFNFSIGESGSYTTASQTVNTMIANQDSTGVNPFVNVGGGNTLTYNLFGNKAILTSVPSMTSGTLTMTGYGFYADMTGMPSALGGSSTVTSYAYYTVGVAGDTKWNIYNNSAINNYMGTGKTGFGITTPTATVHLQAGSATANTAPLQFTTGALETVARIGVTEYNNDLHFTNWKLQRYSIGGSIFDHFADANNGTTVETDLYSDTLIANTFATNGDKVFAQYGGTFVGDATSTQRLRVYFGGTLIFDSGALGIGVTTASWDLSVTCVRESSSNVRCTVSLTTSFATLSAYATYTKVTGLTLTNTQILKITGTAAGITGASNQITATEGYVIFQPAV